MLAQKAMRQIGGGLNLAVYVEKRWQGMGVKTMERLTEQEYQLLKRLSNGPVLNSELSEQERVVMRDLWKRGYVSGGHPDHQPVKYDTSNRTYNGKQKIKSFLRYALFALIGFSFYFVLKGLFIFLQHIFS